MPKPPASGILAILILSLLAGCASDPIGQTTTSTSQVVTDPRDVQASSAGAHVHDYWQGRTEVQVLDAESGQGTLTGTGGDLIVASFRPEDGVIVPQGTSRLTVTVVPSLSSTAVPVPGPGGNDWDRLELWAKTAAAEAAKMGDVVANGTIAIPSSDDDNDPPHYLLSLWEFEVHAVQDDGSQVQWAGAVHVKAVAHRGLPLKEFPAHPDLWNNATELPLLAAEGKVQEFDGGPAYFCTAGCLPTLAPPAGQVVPSQTDIVRIHIEITADSTPVPLRLMWHGADSRNFTVGATGITGTTDIDLDATAKGDSPYAKSSLWEFRLERDTPTQEGAWVGGYNITATAVKG